MVQVAILAASGFEQAEMTIIYKALAEAGHRAVLVSPKKHDARAWDNTRWAGDIPVDVAVIDARAEDYDAMILPGGLLSADTLRADRAAVDLVRLAALRGLPVAALGHSAWVLVEAGLAKGRAMTGHPSIRTDLANAGADWAEDPVVVDGSVVTARNTHDAEAFMQAVLRQLPA